MSADFNRLREVFLAAVEQTPESRELYVGRACAGDAEMRRNLDVLLRGHAAGEGPLDRALPVDDETQSYAPKPDVPGTVVAGRYELLEQIGEGGMGTVWMAEQTEPLRRKVALKLIKTGMDTRQVLARFDAERQALALMDHPNIARVYDGGATDAGRPFFAMELVKGIPITKYCDERRLTPRQRLELFVPVCHAIQHAHQKGIIHRDIKPSNVLVAMYDDKPVPKVIDFGVAKATGQQLTEETAHTGFGAVVGTVEYMSPEQASFNHLDVDTRSDIYSLGVLLYELLAGSTPFSRKDTDSAGLLETLRVIREQEPPKPSHRLRSAEGLPKLAANRGVEPTKLARLVRGELDWIVMKSLEKDRARRYETANAFAMDVERYLASEPVLAGPPSVRYRFRKFVRRNRTAVSVAGLVLALLVFLGCAITWHLGDRARKLALTEQGIGQSLDRASKHREELHAILNRPGGVQELLNQPARWKYMIQTAQSELGHARLLTTRAGATIDPDLIRALDELEQQLSSDDADRLLALRLEEIRLDRDASDRGAIDNRIAAEEYPIAMAGFAVTSDDPTAVASRMRASPIREQLSAAVDDWAWVAFRLRDEELANRLLTIAKAVAPDPEWGDRLRQLSIWRDPRRLSKLVEEAPARRLSPQLLTLIGILLADDDPMKEAWLRRAQTWYPSDFWLSFNLASALGKANPVEAASFLRVALALRPGSSVTYANLGIWLQEQNKIPEAIAAYHKALELDPRNAKAHYNLGLYYYEQKQLPEAITAYRKAIAVYPKYAFAHHNLGLALYGQKKVSEAIACYKLAAQFDPHNPKTFVNLGVAQFDLGKVPEAIAAYRRALELEPGRAETHINLGVALKTQGKLDDAIACYEKVLEIDPKNASAFYNLGIALHGQNKLPEAVAAFQRSVELEPGRAEAHCNLGIALMQQGKVDDAIACCRKAIEIDPKLAIAYNGLGLALRLQNKLPEAVTAFQKAIEFNPKYAKAYFSLGNALHAQLKLPEAIAALQKAIELDPKHAAAHYNLGLALRVHNKVPEAIAAYQRAIELVPDYPEAHCNLGRALEQQGQFEKALAAFRRGHEVGSRKPGWKYPSAQWVRQCERWVELNNRLPAVADGAASLSRPENLEFGQLCTYKCWHAAAAAFYERAYAQENSATHLPGIKAAALAGCGQGEDAAKLDDKERARLRAQALAWLKDDLPVWRKQGASEDSKQRTQALLQLANWLNDPDLAGVRGRDAIDKLPSEEREAWRKLWTEFDRALTDVKQKR